jgi:biopolymer transport protein ExbD
MKFFTRKRRQPPAVIIISLIDILIVMLIFLMVTTTFKQQPAVRLALPESRQPREGVSEASLVVTVAKEQPRLYLGTRAVTLEKLEQELAASVQKNPQTTLNIRADTDAPFGQIVKVMDAAKAANIKRVNASIKNPGLP